MHHHLHHHHNFALVFLSVLIAIFASYTALDLANSISTSQGRIKWLWLLGGSLAMGIGIWAMHFIGMLAFSIPGVAISYDFSLLILSIVVAVIASALALHIICNHAPTRLAYIAGSFTMGAAIAGMHYIGIWSMRMPATIQWDYFYVGLSIVIAVVSSWGALFMAFKLKDDQTIKGFLHRGLGGVLMGFAIAGMHYTGMAAMIISPDASIRLTEMDLLATDGLAAAIIVGTLVILGIALTGSNIDRALSRKIIQTMALEQAIRSRDDFLSIASHELKTPLTSIKLQTEMLLRNLRKKDVEKAALIPMLEKTNFSLDRINRLVDDMLDISRLSTHKLSLQLEEFDLQDLVKEVAERLQPLLQEAHCELRFLTFDTVTGNWDRFRLEQVLTNLLSNAAKYAPGNPIEVKVEKLPRFAEVSVRDHGKGIAPEDQERIFGRFERAEKSLEVRGLGLGLYIVKEIISMHRGEIKVVSKKDDGSEFILRLPYSSTPQDTASKPQTT